MNGTMTRAEAEAILADEEKRRLVCGWGPVEGSGHGELVRAAAGLVAAADADTYNGWANRETWAASLHLSNDEGLYLMCEEWARDAVEEAQFRSAYVVTPEDVVKRATSVMADRLAELVDVWAQDMVDASQTLAGEVRAMLDEIGSRWRVDWRRIAEGYISTALEVDA